MNTDKETWAETCEKHWVEIQASLSTLTREQLVETVINLAELEGAGWETVQEAIALAKEAIPDAK